MSAAAVALAADPCLRLRPPYHGCVPSRRPIILLTGFGPFPGVPENVSAALVPVLGRMAMRAFPGYQLHAEILPTEWKAGPARAAALLEKLRPALVVHFGVSSRATGLTLETRAHKLFRPLCDAAGLLPSTPAAHDNAPEVLRASLPAWLAIERLRQLQIPAAFSLDAGGYLCNAVLYCSLRRARELKLSSRIGFVHLPHRLSPGLPLPAQHRPSISRTGYANGAPGWLSWQQATAGGLAVIATGLGRPLHLAVQPTSGRGCFPVRGPSLYAPEALSSAAR
jgi:pyroglutamyl-peptidase